MKPKALMVMVLLLVSSLLLGGCAREISPSDYDAVAAERDAAQAQVTTLEANLATAENKTASLETELAATQNKTASLRADLAAAEERFDALYIENASLLLKHRQLQAKYDQLVEDYKVLRPQYEGLSPSALPLTIKARNLDITLKEAHILDRIGNFAPLGKFVVLTLEVTNISRTEEVFIPDDFLLIGGGRKLYRPYDFGFNSPTGFIWLYTNITGASTLQVKVAWDVPKDESNLYVLITMEKDIKLWPSVALGL